MTDVEWLACDDPRTMLDHLRRKVGQRRRRVSRRKLRLFALTCWRGISTRSSSFRFDDFEEGLRQLEEVAEGQRKAFTAPANEPGRYVICATTNMDRLFRYLISDHWAEHPGCSPERTTQNAASRHEGSHLLRCIFGNCSPPFKLNVAHRTTTIISLAQAAYDERQMPSGELDPHRLVVFADALEEAGAPGELVTHLRSSGPHVRGCHIVDLCLGLS